jgi:hypothetical protein
MYVTRHSIFSTYQACHCALVTNSKRLLLRAQPLLNDILAILPELSGILDTEAVVEHILNLLQAKTRDLGVEEVWEPSLAIAH